MKATIVELLQQEMARVVVDAGARVAADRVDEALERRAVVNVLAGMDLVADVAARLVVRIEDRPPATAEFLESCFDEARPGVAATDR